MKTRRIALADLQVGMFVTAVDRSFFSNPFMRQRFAVRSLEQIEALKRAGIEAVTIDLDRQEAVPPAAPATDTSASANPAGHAREALMPVTWSPALQGLRQDLSNALSACDRLMQASAQLFDRLQHKGAASIAPAATIARDIMIAAQTHSDAAWFATMSRRRPGDTSLGAHGLATCGIALLIGQALRLDPSELHDLATGALLHDIGLIGLPPLLLQRVHNTSIVLARQDRERYQAHARLGAIQAEGHAQFPLAVRQIIAEHHALPNGRGFPDTIAHRATTRASRIVMIADRYDDLLTGFGGARALQPHEALQRLAYEAQDQALDGPFTAAFLQCVGMNPVYSFVRLNSGEQALVTEVPATAPQHPVVYLMHDAAGHALPSPTRLELAAQDPSQPIRTISQVLGMVQI